MKKILPLTMLFAALLLTAISCGKDDPKPAPGKDDPKNPPTQQTDPTDQKIEVTGVSLDKETLTLEVGAEGTLTATVAPATATDKTITWSSSDESVATVENGKVTAIAVGEATITATTNNGKTATCKVTVKAKPIAVESVVFKNTAFTIIFGTDLSIVPTVLPENADDKTLTFSSNDEIVATVDQQGNITTTGVGEVTITATAHNGVSGSVVITVNPVSGAPKTISGIETVYIPAGTFLMGSPNSDSEAFPDEKPQHSVTLTKSYYMGRYEITNAQYVEFLNAKKIGGLGMYNEYKLIEALSASVQYNSSTNEWEPVSGYANHPAVNVTWYGAAEFAKWVGGRLPTEAEWEYACRAGTTTLYYWGSTLTNADIYAWYADNSDHTTHAVGEKQPNAWGLYDMAGNVSEWCSDAFRYYSSSAQTDPTGKGSNRAIRGSNYNSGSSRYLRLCYRNESITTSYSTNRGFRVVFDE